MSSKLTRRSFLSRTALGASSLVCLPRALYARYEEEADAADNDVVLRFSALSDVHFKKNRDCVEAVRFRRSMDFMYEYSESRPYKNFDGMLVAGDMTDHGWDEELTFFKEVMDSGIREGTETIICMGNHEFIGGSKKRWEEIFERPSNKVYDVKGFKFIALSPEKGTNRTGDFQYALDWYTEELDKATAADPDKPIFTFQHYHVTPTVYGSRGEDNWGIADLYEPLQKYPRVINFSGHSHYPMNDPRSAWQGRFSAFGAGTLSYFEMGSEGGKYNKFPKDYNKAAQLYVVEVRRDNSVALKPYDLISDSFFDVVYTIAKPGAFDKYLYTDARYQTSAKPAWDDDATATCSSVESDLAILEFPQAKCQDVVHSYRVEIEKKENDAWEEYATQYFWSEYYFKEQPSVMRIELAVEPEGSYRAKIVALNPFFKESERTLEVEFATPKDELDGTDRDAPTPSANVFDVQFKDEAVNAAVNGLDKQKELQKFSEPKIVEDAAFGGRVGRFDGVDDRYKIAFNSREYRRIGKATLAAKFKFEKFRDSENMVVVANTQGKGMSLELNGKTKALEFWAFVAGSYRILSAPVKEGEAIDAFGTFDGKTLALYVDGKEVAKQEIKGRVEHPDQPGVQAFCVGSDISGGGDGSNYFKGEIARARLFSWGLTAEQVANLSK